MSKTKLDIPYKCYYKLFAISSSLKDYRASYFINNSLSISLKKVNNLIIDNKKKSEVYSFELQKDEDSDTNFDFFLINNKTIGKQLISSLKGFDYIFLIKSDEELTDQSETFKKLKAVNQFQIVLDIDKLSTRDNNIIERNVLYNQQDKKN
jgi:hypothetical protein